MEGTQPVCKYSNPAKNKIWIQNIPNKLSYELIIFIRQLLSLIESKMKFIIDTIDISLVICDVKNILICPYYLGQMWVGNFSSLGASLVRGHYAW